MIVKYAGVIVLGLGILFGLYKLIRLAINWIKNKFEID